MSRALLILVPLSAVLLGLWLRFSDCNPELAVLEMVGIKPGYYEDKVVWVVGASSGIGEHFAKEVAKYGAQLVLSARRVDRLQQVASECKGKHAPLVVPLDMLSYDTHQAAVDSVLATHGRIDVLLLNAGRTQRSLAEDAEFEVTESILSLNFLSQVHLFKKVLPVFLSQGSGHVGVVSSVSGLLGVPLSSSYSASKWALNGYFGAVRSETSHRNVSVSVICPGPVVSEIAANALGTSLEKIPEQTDDDASKMSTERCAHLMTLGMSYKMKELWISTQPVLVLLYLNQFFPALFNYLWDTVLGPLRVKVFKSGGDLYDIRAALSAK